MPDAIDFLYVYGYFTEFEVEESFFESTMPYLHCILVILADRIPYTRMYRILYIFL